MVSFRSCNKASSSGVLKCVTGWATRSKRASPILRISRTVMVGLGSGRSDCVIAAVGGAGRMFGHQRQQARFIEHSDAQFLRLVEFAASL